MSNKDVKITYIFENPNTPEEFEELLRSIILQKLLSGQQKNI